MTAAPTSATPWHMLYPAGVEPDLTSPTASMLEAWDRTLHRLGREAPGIHYFDLTLSLGEVEDAATALANGLWKRGLRPGDRLAVYLQNDPQWIIAALAAWRCGASVAAVNPMLREKELTHLLRDSGARHLLCLESLLPIVAGVAGVATLDVVIATTPHDLPPGALGAAVLGPRPEVGELLDVPGATVVRWADAIAPLDGVTSLPDVVPGGDDIAMLTYTSGTTGRAKGAMNTHRCLAHSTEVYRAWFDLDDTDVLLGVAPLFHITGAVAGLCLMVATGAPLVLLHRFDADTTVRAIEMHGATFTVAASTALIALTASPAIATADVSSLRKTASGGAPVSPALVERIRAAAGWRIRGVYGMTETSSPTHLAPLDSPAPVDERSGALSVGIPVPGADVRIVDVETATPLAAGEEGEIIVRGPMVVPGYWGNPEETAHAVRDGWLHTGDIGVMHEDGWLFVVDRLKDLINAGGYKVWPREVEDGLAMHPAVREVAVVGVPDDYRGETVRAFVSLRSNHDVTPEELIAFAREQMAAYKRPTQVVIVPEIPKNAAGKILRRELR